MTGSAPGWSDPWSRARPGTVAQIVDGYAALALDGEAYAEVIACEDIQALRRLVA